MYRKLIQMKLRRKLISKHEGKVSILQIMGFVLISLGITYFLGRDLYDLIHIKDIPPPSITAEEVSIIFFIIMLGFSLAFPDLLRDPNKGLSAMRITVFMITNMICMLFLKVGWSAKNLTSIGVDGYWMGIIAFMFGAKATQAYFESKMAVAKAGIREELSANEYSDSDIAKLAVLQNEQFLKAKFPNILSVSDAVIDPNYPNYTYSRPVFYASTGDPTVQVWRRSWFFGITYNFR